MSCTSRWIIRSSILLSSLNTSSLAWMGTSSCSKSCSKPAPFTFGRSSESRCFASSTDNEEPILPPLNPSAKRLFLVRHGEVINPGGDRPVYYGAMDVPLSPLGEDEAKAAGVYLQQHPLDLVVASPLRRAKYGAKQVLSRQSSSIISSSEIMILDGFMEMDRGDWCGKTLDEIGPENMARFDACDESVTPPNGESYPFLKNRVLSARDTVLRQLKDGQSAAIVSHLQVTRCMLSEALGIPIENMSTLKVATASVTCIDYDSNEDGKMRVRYQSFKPDAGLASSRDLAN